METIDLPGYEVVSVLGAGTSAKTYLAHNKKGKKVVVRRLFDDLAANEGVVERFLGASQLSSKIKMRRHVAEILGQRRSGDGVYLVREYNEGKSLAAHLREGTLASLDLRRVAKSVCDGIRAMNGQKVVHGGIHPGNVIIEPNGLASLTDFATGRAALCQEVRQPYPIDALRYLSPEQINGKSFDERADIYAAGLIVALLVSGKPAFDADDWNRLEGEIRAGHANPLACVSKAVSVEPKRRHAKIDAFWSELNAEWQQEKEPAPPPKPKPKPKPEPKVETKPEPKPEPKAEPKPPPQTVRAKSPVVSVFDMLTRQVISPNNPRVFVSHSRAKLQRPLRISNSGDAELDLALASHGKGISVSPDHLVIPPGQSSSVIVTLAGNSGKNTNLACNWRVDRVEHKFVVSFIR